MRQQGANHREETGRPRNTRGTSGKKNRKTHKAGKRGGPQNQSAAEKLKSGKREKSPLTPEKAERDRKANRDKGSLMASKQGRTPKNQEHAGGTEKTPRERSRILRDEANEWVWNLYASSTECVEEAIWQKSHIGIR